MTSRLSATLKLELGLIDATVVIDDRLEHPEAILPRPLHVEAHPIDLEFPGRDLLDLWLVTVLPLVLLLLSVIRGARNFLLV